MYPGSLLYGSLPTARMNIGSLLYDLLQVFVDSVKTISSIPMHSRGSQYVKSLCLCLILDLFIIAYKAIPLNSKYSGKGEK
mmetsp:Transcript_126991/g.201428  ORF Transcript_126991/g.201428 Transcript_126991/m.201428 type:complete len:81 (-) Transcript_126991:141-383(-)